MADTDQAPKPSPRPHIISIALPLFAVGVSITVGVWNHRDPDPVPAPARRLLADVACFPHQLPAPLVKYYEDLREHELAEELEKTIGCSSKIAESDRRCAQCLDVFERTKDYAQNRAEIPTSFRFIRTQCVIKLSNVGTETIEGIHAKLSSATYSVVQDSDDYTLAPSLAGLQDANEVDIKPLRPTDEAYIISWGSSRGDIVISHSKGMAEYDVRPPPPPYDPLARWVERHPGAGWALAVMAFWALVWSIGSVGYSLFMLIRPKGDAEPDPPTNGSSES